ncbi:carboxyl-terminal processing protease [Paenibacillus sp. GP183]|nr:carboxyl-terminal processing protease [Paenibacillus sp. GP183]
MRQRHMNRLKVTLALTSVLLLSMPALAAADESSLQTSQVRTILSNVHVSGVTESDLSGKSIKEMLAQLQDPYTMYFSDSELKKFENSIENNVVGMGARVGIDADGVYLIEVFAGSPAEKAGMQRDDYIQAINGVSVKGESLSAVVAKIVGEAGTSVQLSVLREGKLINVNITRAAVNIPEVYSKRFDGNIGYIQVTDFSSDADEEFTKQLLALKSKGLSSLIIDLRDDPGGFLESAQNIFKNFIKEGTLIHTRDRNNQDQPILIQGGSSLDVPVYMLLNENSASASEVLAGAMQDYGVAKVIGLQSYGKGSVQQLYEIPAGGALKVTIEEYLTPNKHKVNKVGITPDIVADGSAAQMITALKKAGIQNVTVESSKHKVLVNGVEIRDTFPLFRENGKLFAPTRALAAMIEAGISWNNETRAVEISSAGKKLTFPVEADKLVIKAGTSYVNVDQFASVFSQLQVTDQGEKVTIRAVKGN